MKKQIMALLALAVTQVGLAQEETSATLYGYVRGEFAFDSRQVVAAREGNYIDLASPVNKVNGKDLNANPNFNGWGVESRLGVKIAGPEFFGMKSEALIESHFFGSSDASINTLALRHAYVKLSSDKVEWLVGQFWHPMFVTNVSPRTYNFNAGSPFQPFNRSPQIRFSTKGNARLTLAAITERDFASVGGKANLSALPAFHAQLQFGNDDKFVGGFGANYKSLKSGLRGEYFGAFTFLAYAKAKLGQNSAWQIYADYGQNPSELLQLGGVAVDAKGKYKSNNTLALWTEFYGDFTPSFEWGIFGGYSKDFGFSKNTTPSATKFGQMADIIDPLTGKVTGQYLAGTPISTWRVSPRVGWKSGNTKLTAELDYTSTTYGAWDTNLKTKKYAQDATAGNFRVSLSLIQNF